MQKHLARGLAVVGATGALIGGGAALANAATGGSDSGSTNTQSTPAATTPQAPSQSQSRAGCPHDGQAPGGGNSGSGYGAPGPATNPST
jgi:hypothetical protein